MVEPPSADLFSQVVSFQNLLLAFHKAARGKRGKAEVADFEFDLDKARESMLVDRVAYAPG